MLEINCEPLVVMILAEKIGQVASKRSLNLIASVHQAIQLSPLYDQAPRAPDDQTSP